MAGENDNQHAAGAGRTGPASREDTAAEEPRVVVRDRRKIDPETGKVRTEEKAAEVEAEVAEIVTGEPDPELAKQLEERTADLQRLQAEYANYRRRVERDREVASTNAKAGLVSELLTVLDDVERAEQHGDLTGPFKAVAEKLGAVLQKSGLESFGATGEPFDPQVHEAVQHDTSADVAGPTVTTVLRRGYTIGDRVVRSALVGVTDYEAPAADAPVIDGEVVDAEPGFTEPEQQ